MGWRIDWRGQNYHLDKDYTVVENRTGRSLDADEVRKIYESVEQSLTKFIMLMGYPDNGGSRKVAHKVMARYGLEPKAYQPMRVSDITAEQANAACKESRSITEMGHKLGCRSDARAYKVARSLIKQYNLDISHFKWRPSEFSVISKAEARKMLNEATTLRELGAAVREQLQSRSDRIYLARRIISLYGLDDTKFQQSPTDGMTRDEVLDAYFASQTCIEFMRRLGYKGKDRFKALKRRFGLPEREDWSCRSRPKQSAYEKPVHDSKTIYDLKPTRERLLAERGHACEICGRTVWQGHDIPLEIHHIDGVHTHDTWDNVQLLCCNCHSQISVKQAHERGFQIRVTTEKLIQALMSYDSISAAIRSLGVACDKIRYQRCYDLITERRISPHYENLIYGADWDMDNEGENHV